MPNVTRTWNSLSEFTDYCSGASEMPDAYRTSQTRGRSFHGSHSFEDAQAIAFHWPEGVERIENVKARISLKSQRVMQQVEMREAGPGVLSMGHYLAGHPQPYMALVDSERVASGSGAVVKILMNISVSSAISKEVIERRGAAVLALVAALEQTGRRVEIVVGTGGRGQRNWTHDYRVTVKKAQAKLNLNSVAFALAHPDMLRRFVFAAMEREDERFRKGFSVGSGYGRPARFENVPENVIHVHEATYGEPQWETEESCAAWVVETLKAQGVEIH